MTTNRTASGTKKKPAQKRNAPPPPPSVLGMGHNAQTWRPPTPPPARSSPDDNDDENDGRNGTWIGSLLWGSKRRRRGGGSATGDEDEKGGYRSPQDGLVRDDVRSKEGGGDGGLEEILIDHSLALHDESSGGEMKKAHKLSPRNMGKKGRNRRTVKDSLLSSFGIHTNSDTNDDDVENQHDSNGTTDDRKNEGGSYQMMKSQHGITTQVPHRNHSDLENTDQNNEPPYPTRSFFFDNFNDDQPTSRSRTNTNTNKTRPSPWSVWFTHTPSRPFSPPPPPSSEYFHNRTPTSFLHAHHLLNDPLPPKNGNSSSSSDTDDENFFFSLGQPQEARKRREGGKGDVVPAVSDLTRSSLSYMHGGRIRMRVPKDGVRLLMDPLMEPGILCVERNAGNGGDRSVGDGKKDWKKNVDRVERAVKREERKQIMKGARRKKSASVFSSGRRAIGEQQTLQNRDEEEENFSLMSDNVYNDDYELSIMKSLSGDNSYNSLETDEESDEQQMHSRRLQISKQRQKYRRRRKRGRLPELSYVLTVDQDLYKRVVREMSDNLHTPCGLYYCCHEASGETKHVDIGVAIGLLCVVLTLMFIGTCYWPYS